MASYEVGEDGEDSAATAQSRNLCIRTEYSIYYCFSSINIDSR